MLRVLAWLAQFVVLGLAAYNLATALWGWRNPRRIPPGGRARSFRVVVPAHDEEAVIAGLLEGLRFQDYPAGLVGTWVLADRCTDATAAVAASYARVEERTGGPPGKGALLGWHLGRFPLGAGEALVVLDADNRVPPDLLARFADELDAGEQAVQAYLDVVRPDGSVLGTASALSYWASNRMVQLARHNLGWSADLGGTGMCLTAGAVAAAGGFGQTLTEDQEMAIRLVEAGIRVSWLHDVRVRDEKPTDLGVALRQRARWMAGKRAVARRHVSALLRAALRQRSWGPVDAAVRLVQPGRSFMVLVAVLAGAWAALFPNRYLLSWPVWVVAAGVQLLAPLPFLARDGVEGRYLVRYPLLAVFGLLWLPARVLSRRVRGWYHTPHEGSGDLRP